MNEKYCHKAIELIEWLNDHHSSDSMERVAEVAKRLGEVAADAEKAEAARWASPPMTSGPQPCPWETT